MRYLYTLIILSTLSACMGATAPVPNDPQPSVVQESVKVAMPLEVPAENPGPPRLKADHASLMGLSPRSVQAMVGEPSLVRRDENVQVMLYEIPACVLEVIFYEPDPQASFEVKHISARQRNGDDVDTSGCLEAVLPNGYWLEHNDAIIE